MSDRHARVRQALDRLYQSAAKLTRPVTFMEVCGTHTMSAFRTGLHSLMPANVHLLSGPGCPVCVTCQADIDLLIRCAAVPGVTLCTYGDMLRVPGGDGSLEKARSRGADVRVVYSTLDAVKLAQAEPERQVVFGAVGFETTAPATAAAVLQAERSPIGNFSVLTSHKRVVPAMLALLAGGQMRLDGFMCPGHVSIIIGSDAYRPIVEQYRLGCVIGGFEELLMADALAQLVEMVLKGKPELANDYPEAVKPQGNLAAQKILDQVFTPGTVRWRGLGEIADSGLVLREKYHNYDAQRRFGLKTPPDQEPEGCLCGQVITGLVSPHECALFGTECTPIHPIGPCMVSSEGTCQAYFKYHRNI